VLLDTGEYRSAALLASDDKLSGAFGDAHRVLSVNESGWGDLWLIACEPAHVFCAGGLVHHNKPIHVISPGAASL
jgi:hypothetical protein